MSELKWYAVYSGMNESMCQVQATSKEEAEEKVRSEGRSYMGALWAIQLPFYPFDDEICNQIVGELMWGGLSEILICDSLNKGRRSEFLFDLGYILVRLSALKREGILQFDAEKWELVK